MKVEVSFNATSDLQSHLHLRVAIPVLTVTSNMTLIYQVAYNTRESRAI